MTTTSTFQGVNADSKPSSRVLRPPGGSSSNIFGFDDQPPQQQQKTPVRNADNVNRGNNDIFNQGPGTAAGAAAPPKPRAPRGGDDSFHNIFGNDQSAELTKTSSKAKKSATSFDHDENSESVKSISRRQHNSPDSFANVFGEPDLNHRKMVRRVRNINDDSFSHVFGHGPSSSFEPSVSQHTMPTTIGTSSASASASVPMCKGATHMGEVSPNPSPSTTSLVPSSISHSSFFREVPAEDEDIASSFSRVFGQYMAEGKPSRGKKVSNRGAYNPITGEMYEQSKPAASSAQSTTESMTSKEVTVGSSPPTSDPSSSTATLIEQQSNSPPETAPQSEDAASAPAPAAAPPQKQRQTGGMGIFGPPVDEAQEHRSTRVSQPPGGRSTKLW